MQFVVHSTEVQLAKRVLIIKLENTSHCPTTHYTKGILTTCLAIKKKISVLWKEKEAC